MHPDRGSHPRRATERWSQVGGPLTTAEPSAGARSRAATGDAYAISRIPYGKS